MRKLDWYILKKYLVTFFFCMVLFMVVAVAIDASEKMDDFVKTDLSTFEIFTEYYLGFIPFIWGLLFPLFVFIAVIFFTSKMALRSEIIAILASGTSFNRMLLPYLIGGLMMGGLLWYGNSQLIPKANKIQADFKTNYLDKRDPTKNQKLTNCTNCYYRRIASDTYIGIKNYDTSSKSASQFFMEKIKDGKVVYNLRSSNLQWDTATKKWKLTNAVERKVEKMGEEIKQHASLILNINLQPEELRRDDYIKDKLTSPELIDYIRQEELRGSEGLSAMKVERYRRIATPFSVLLLTLIGAVMASRKTRGGSGLHLALGIIIAALFIISDRFSTVFATKSNFPPLLAAWLPNIVFSAVAFWLYKKAPK